MSTVNVADIRVNGGTQSRAQIDREVVAEYAEAVENGADFPPLVVFFDGATYWLADGFHRYEAYSRARRFDVPADVRQGTQRDAILYSVGANASHGLRRTRDDKRRAVLTLLNDPEWGAWSDREVAKACAVSHTFVAERRRDLTGNVASEKRSYTTKHGTPATMATAAIGRREDRPTEARQEPPVDPVPGALLEPANEPDLPEDEHAKLRRELGRLTLEALVDEVVGLRQDLAEAKLNARNLKAERDDLKAKLAEAQQSDLGRALGNAQRRADAAAGRMNEYMATVKRLEYRLKKAEDRVRELEGTPIQMDAA